MTLLDRLSRDNAVTLALSGGAFVLVAGFTFFTIRQGATPPLYLREPVIDVGHLSPLQSVTKTFTIVNRSGADFAFDTVTAECGCTEIDPGQDTILKHSTVEVPVTVDARKISRERGVGDMAFRKQALLSLVNRSSAMRHNLVLQVVGEIHSDDRLIAFPGVVQLGSVGLGDEVRRSIRFEGPRAVVDAIPERIVLNEDGATGVSVPDVAESKDIISKTTHLVFVSHAATIGPFELSVQISPGPQHESGLVIPVVGERVGPIAVTPRRLYLTASNSAPPPQAQLLVSTSSRTPIALNRISTELPLKWTAEPAKDGRALVINVYVEATSDLVGVRSGIVSLEFANPKTRIQVPAVIVSMTM